LSSRSYRAPCWVLARICELGGPAPKDGPAASLTDDQIAAIDRANRIDAILDRIPNPSARALRLRYGFEEERPVLNEVLPNISGVATLTAAAHTWFARRIGKPPRPRSSEVRNFLEDVCRRVSLREASAVDELVLVKVRTEAERTLIDAEKAYEDMADRFDRKDRRWAA
jgi:hypothetical protein